MSRRYRIEVNIETIRMIDDRAMWFYNLKDLLKYSIGIKVYDYSVFSYSSSFTGEISLCAGELEEHAHIRICNEIKEHIEHIKEINTGWLYLEKYDEHFITRIGE